MASINVTTDTHAQIRFLARRLVGQDVDTSIGDVTEHLWAFVDKKHKDEFEAYVREKAARR